MERKHLQQTYKRDEKKAAEAVEELKWLGEGAFATTPEDDPLEGLEEDEVSTASVSPQKGPGDEEDAVNEGGEDKRRSRSTGGEMFYLDKDGKEKDADLHAEMLGEDIRPWDVDLDYFETLKTDEEREAYLDRLDRLMGGE